MNEQKIDCQERIQQSHDYISKFVSTSYGYSPSTRHVLLSKTRIQWTQDLHEKFVECVNCLGGAYKAPPKSILKLMNVDGLTIFHVKSHLQKFRNSEYPPGSAKGKSEKRTTSNVEPQLDVETGLHIEKAIQLELDVQQHLHEQLEIQRNLQLRIEEQGKQLKNIIELQLKTIIDLQLKNSDTTFYEGTPSGSVAAIHRERKEAKVKMEDVKKRKLEDASGNDDDISTNSEDHLRSLLEPLAKSQLVDLLAKLGSQYPSIAEEIKGVASADPVHRKLFVRGLAWNTSSETLRAAFSEHGEIEEGAVIYEKASGKSRGYGFITYKHMESTQCALRAPSKLIDGRLAVCNLAAEGLSGTPATLDLTQRKLYIGGLSPNVTSEMLLHFFGRHGDIEEGSVAYDKDTNESRGFGFVTYRAVEAAKKAIDDPQKTLGGRNIIVKLADSHKGRTVQTQLPPAMVPMALPLAQPGYPQPGKAHAGTPPVGYSYPQTIAAYPDSSYPGPQPPYPAQSQIPYPYYIGKQ